MRYMFLIYEDPARKPDYQSPEGAAAMAAWGAFAQATVDAGVNDSGAPLQPPHTATTVRSEAGKVVTTDGPFAETKEVLGGFFILDCKDLDHALEWAAKFPNVRWGSVEVRPVWEM